MILKIDITLGLTLDNCIYLRWFSKKKIVLTMSHLLKQERNQSSSEKHNKDMIKNGIDNQISCAMVSGCQ